MSSSGQYTYTVNTSVIGRQALINTGKFGGTQFISPIHINDVNVKLNLLLRQWMAKQDMAQGLKVWSRVNADLFLSLTKHTYRLGPTTSDNWAAGVATGSVGQNFQQGQLTQALAVNGVSWNVGTANAALVTVGDYLVLECDSGDIFSTTATGVNTGTGIVTAAAGPPSTAASGSYVWNYTTKGQRPLELSTCVLRDINNNDTPMDFMTLQTYEMLPTKVQSQYVSDPAAIWYQADSITETLNGVTGVNGSLRLDCGGEQDVTKHLNIWFLRPLQAFVNPTDTADVNEEWQSALVWALTKEICPMFNAGWTQNMQDSYAEALSIARGTNPERTELFFEPNADHP